MIIQGSINKCDVCGHRWLSEGIMIPKRCAKCKSGKWNSGPRPADERSLLKTGFGVAGTDDHRALGGEPRTAQGGIPSSSNSLSPEAKEKREAEKAARADRKKELREQVSGAVANPPSRAPKFTHVGVDVARPGADRSVERVTSEGKKVLTAIADAPCIHPSKNRTAGKNWRCTACGYQHKVSA